MKLRIIPLLLVLGACGRSPEEAQKRLAEINIAPTPESLIAKTKEAQGGDVAKLLVQSGVDPNARQENGMTALMSAVFNGQEDVARALLDKGALVNADAKGYTALSLAVERGSAPMAKLLLEHGAEAKKRPPGGLSALEKAQQQQKAELVSLLEKSAK